MVVVESAPEVVAVVLVAVVGLGPAMAAWKAGAPGLAAAESAAASAQGTVAAGLTGSAEAAMAMVAVETGAKGRGSTCMKARRVMVHLAAESKQAT